MYLWYQSAEDDNAVETLLKIFKNSQIKIADTEKSFEENIASFPENGKSKKYLIIKDGHFFTGKETESKNVNAIQFIKKLYYQLEQKNIHLLFISPYPYNVLPMELRDFVFPMELPLMSVDEIKEKFKVSNPECFAGLTKKQIEYILKLKLNPQQEQAKIFAGYGFELKKPVRTFDTIAGYHNLRTWIQKRVKLVKEKDPFYKLKGILLIGAPGVGKSVVCEAIAKEFDFPYLRWNVSKVMSHYYSETETRVYTALERLKVLPGAVLQIDEIDKMLGGYESSFATDGGTTARMLGIIQTWMAEQENIFIIGTTNKPLSVDYSLIRKGRFNECFYVPLPDKIVRAELFELYAKKFGLDIRDKMEDLVNNSQGLSGAEIETLLLDYYIESKYSIINIMELLDEAKRVSETLKYDNMIKNDKLKAV